jgi:DNA polymerase-3 subunit epsilon
VSAPALASDAAFMETVMLVIDFEATTPAGHRPQPVEVAALAVQHVPGRGPEPTGWTFESLIRPPAFAPLTAFQARTTGLRLEDVAAARPVDQVLAELDSQLPDGPVLLVAQHAPVEAGLLYAHCPRLARTPLLDTRLLAKALHPGLPDGYGLDALILALGLNRPADRHRAMPDVIVTAAAPAADRRRPLGPVRQSRGPGRGGRLPCAGRAACAGGTVLNTAAYFPPVVGWSAGRCSGTGLWEQSLPCPP